METVQHILGLPENVVGIGNVYPIRVKDFDSFGKVSGILMFTTQSLELVEDVDVFDVLLYYARQDGGLLDGLFKLFSLALRTQDIHLTPRNDELHFKINEQGSIHKGNYSVFRQTVMRQNLMFEKPKFSSKVVAEWADKVLASRSKNGTKYTIEDIITTVSVFTGKSYDLLAEQTLYQLYADFRRVSKLKDYDTLVDFKCAGADKISLNHFAEEINMFANPYEGLFVNASNLSANKVLPIKEE